MKRKNKKIALSIFVTSLFMTGCTVPLNETVSKVESTEEAQAANEKPFITDQLEEDKEVYNQTKQTGVIDLYVTVFGKEDLNFYQLNHWYENNRELNEKSPKLDAIIQEGDQRGPLQGKLGYGTKVSNATIEIRGNSSKLVQQKSYQIKLADNAGLWQGQTVINLNKHLHDITRVRNKLSFDLFEEIPHFTSLRTQFVHLHIKDLTADSPDHNYEDYGLFTQIEQPNKRFLYAHGLDPNGNLYKANLFEFYRYPDKLKLATDPDYNKEEFESILQIKGSEDHDKLLKMLDDVNNYNMNINTVVDKYFDRDNYLTWLALNLLMGNIDTDAQNYFLYNPLNSEKFYFLPWDYDAAWGQQEEETAKFKGFTAKWQLGLSNYWGGILHRRFFKDPANVDELSKKIEELSKTITRDKIQGFLDGYYPIVNSYIKKSPDLDRLPYKIENFDKSYKNLVNIPEKNKDIYYQNMENPMPIYLSEPELQDGQYTFSWDPSFDLQGDDITYDFQVSKTIDFSAPYIEKKNLTATEVSTPVNKLIKGKNYWRVIIKDSKGNTQEAFDRMEMDGQFYNGLLEFDVD